MDDPQRLPNWFISRLVLISASNHLYTKPSAILANWDVREIGLSLVIVAGCSLGMGATTASFQACGTIPVRNDRVKNISDRDAELTGKLLDYFVWNIIRTCSFPNLDLK